MAKPKLRRKPAMRRPRTKQQLFLGGPLDDKVATVSENMHNTLPLVDKFGRVGRYVGGVWQTYEAVPIGSAA